MDTSFDQDPANAAVHRTMPDVAVSPQGHARGVLDWAGMAGIRMPIRFDAGDGAAQRADAHVDAFVNLLNSDQRGIHMSRLYLCATQTLAEQPLDRAALARVLAGFLASQQPGADRARIRIRFDQLVRRPALASSHSGWRAYPVTVDATLVAGRVEVELATEVLYSSTCPASAALARQLVQEQFARDFPSGAPLDRATLTAWLGSERGMIATPHAQRSMAGVRVRLATDADLHLLRLLDRVEGALGTPVQTAVKREDEQAFARANGSNLMFCEDAARRIKLALAPVADYADFLLRVEHRESLHAHDAVAYASKGTQP
jgi:GTP cyclohydrolase I